MLKRTAFKPKARPREKVERVYRTPAVAASAFRLAVAADTGTAAAPKDEAHRNPRLLTLARGMPCLLRVPGVCSRDVLTTVAAHSNWACHGKGMARKASDAFSCWACGTCHSWLDQGPAPKATKQAAFMRAHTDQVLLWRQIATDPGRPAAARRAAQWALDLLNPTTTGETP